MLWFRSSSSAWLLDGSVTVDDMYSTENHRMYASAAMRAGLRSYRPLAPRVVRYVGGGVTTAYSTYRNVHRVTGSIYETWTVGGGPYGEIGAEYLVTSYLGIGAGSSATVLLRGGRTRLGDEPDESSELGWSLNAGGVRVLATIYF